MNISGLIPVECSCGTWTRRVADKRPATYSTAVAHSVGCEHRVRSRLRPHRRWRIVSHTAGNSVVTGAFKTAAKDHPARLLNRWIAEPHAGKKPRNSSRRKSAEIFRRTRLIGDAIDYRRVRYFVWSASVCAMDWQSRFTWMIYIITMHSFFANGWSHTTPSIDHRERLRLMSAPTVSSGVPDSGDVTKVNTTKSSIAVGT